MRLLIPFFIVPLAIAMALPAFPTVDVEKRSVNVGWPYGTDKIRGVNIGGVSRSTSSPRETALLTVLICSGS